MEKRKGKLNLDETTVLTGSWITIGHPIIAEVMVNSKFDFLTIDLEHSVISLETAQILIQIISKSSCKSFVRIPENNPTIIKKVTDMGVDGIIVPMVNSKEDAILAVESAHYPPFGKRGVGLARAQKYGTGFKTYKTKSKDTIIIVQIEHKKAVENFEEIMSVDGIDGFLIGPYDLSASLGKSGDFSCTEVQSAIEHVKSQAKKLNVVSGIHLIEPSPNNLTQAITDGYQFIVYSLDTLLLARKCEERRPTLCLTQSE